MTALLITCSCLLAAASFIIGIFAAAPQLYRSLIDAVVSAKVTRIYLSRGKSSAAGRVKQLEALCESLAYDFGEPGDVSGRLVKLKELCYASDLLGRGGPEWEDVARRYGRHHLAELCRISAELVDALDASLHTDEHVVSASDILWHIGTAYPIGNARTHNVHSDNDIEEIFRTRPASTAQIHELLQAVAHIMHFRALGRVGYKIRRERVRDGIIGILRDAKLCLRARSSGDYGDNEDDLTCERIKRSCELMCEVDGRQKDNWRLLGASMEACEDMLLKVGSDEHLTSDDEADIEDLGIRVRRLCDRISRGRD